MSTQTYEMAYVIQAEVQCHEPHAALDGGGQDGLPAVDSVCRTALRLLKPGGFLAVETGGECLLCGRPISCHVTEAACPSRCHQRLEMCIQEATHYL